MPRAARNPRSTRTLSLVTGGAASDTDVARALRDGEAWATAETWHRMAPMVMVMAERCLGSRSEAEDLTQEVFCRVFRKAPTLRDPDSLRSFVYSFAIRGLRTELRKRRLRAWLPLEVLHDAPSQSLDVESRDLLRRFHRLLDRLSSRDRLVFVLRRMESMTVEEIALHLDLSPSTVKRSMARAASKLTRWIEVEPAMFDLLESRGDPR